MATILHIEDDPRNRLLVRKLLAAEGHTVVDAENGLEGVRLALSEKPDLILVDLNLPGLDGFEVTLRLRTEAQLDHVAIVAITAEGDRDTSKAVGCDGFLQKPIDARTFGKQLEQFLKRERVAADVETSEKRLRQQSGRIVARLEEKVAELSRANDRLRDLDRLRTEFYRNISHELATPLTPIVGYLQMMVDEELGDISKPQEKALRAMQDCIRRLRVTLDNLIDVTGLETGRMQFINKDYDFLEAVRRGISATSDSFEERKIARVEDFARGPLPAFGDVDRIARAVSQLLDNAVKFSPEKCGVALRVRALETTYELSVCDAGQGILEANSERVFEPFYQVDGSATRTYGGVGVGLAIARRVARGQGGDIRVRNGALIAGVKYPGACFTMTVAKRAPTVVHGAA